MPDAVLDASNVVGHKDLCPGGAFMLVEEERQKANLSVWNLQGFESCEKKPKRKQSRVREPEYGQRKP